MLAATFVAHNLPDFLVYCCSSGAALGLVEVDSRCGFMGFKLRQPIDFYARGALE